MYYVYVLKSSKSKKFYFGYTNNLEKRLREHKAGKSRYTKGHLPVRLVYYSAFGNRKLAKDFELYLKSGSGKAFAYKRLLK